MSMDTNSRKKTNRLRRILIALTAAVLVVALTFALVACNKDKKKQQAERADSVALLRGAVLESMGEGWKNDLPADKIAELDEPGDYVLANGWAKLVCEELKDSTLQTAKLNALAQAVASEDGKQLMHDFSANAEKLVPLVRSVGFTQDDVSEIVFRLLNALASKSGEYLQDMRDLLLEVRGLNNVKYIAKVNDALSSVRLAIDSVVPTKTMEQRLLSAFEDAKQGLDSIVSFAYSSSQSASDELWSALLKSDGALENISDGEIEAVANAVMNNVGRLKNALSGDQLDKLNVALGLVIDQFDASSISSALFASVVQYAKYAYTLVDVLPMLCDAVLTAGDVILDREALDFFKGQIKNEELSGEMVYNLCIATARVVEGTLDKYDLASVSALLDDLADACRLNQGVFDWQKAIPILVADIALNLSDIVTDGNFEGELSIRHPEAVSAEDISRMSAAVFGLSRRLDAFKQAYYKFARGETSSYNNLLAAANACRFDDLGAENPYDYINETADWYNYYMTVGLDSAKAAIEGCAKKALADIKLYAEDYFKQGSEQKTKLDALAKEQFKQSMTEEEFETAFPRLRESGVVGFAATILIMIMF